MSFSTKKTVYFIRHGESESNAAMLVALDSFFDLVTFSNFSLDNISKFQTSLMQLLFGFDENPALSELGIKQACSVNVYAKKEFDDMTSDVMDIKIMYRSFCCLLINNLQRAKHTAKLALPTLFDEAVEVPLLQEATKLEHIFSSSLLTRIAQFEQWLSTVEEKTVVIVGHGQYFKHMLHHSSNIHNCDVWKTDCVFTHGGVSGEEVKVQWHTPQLEFRSPLAYKHPMNRFSWFYKDSSLDIPRVKTIIDVNESGDDNGSISRSDNEEEEEEEDKDEVTCRICQMTASESKMSDVFIRPCKCTGSLSHVHINCLNEWRATSASAAYKCFVCQYTYRIERTSLSSFLMSELGTHVISFLMISLSTVLVGGVGIRVCKGVLSIDLCEVLCRITQWHMWWRDCSFRLLPFKFRSFLSFWTNLLFRQDVDSVRAVFLCHWVTVVAIEVLLVGCALMGVVGIFAFLFDEGIEIYQQFGHGNHDWQYLAFVGCWLASLGSTNMGRLGIWLGFAVSCRSLFYKIRRLGKRVAQTIGERILEPNT